MILYLCYRDLNRNIFTNMFGPATSTLVDKPTAFRSGGLNEALLPNTVMLENLTSVAFKFERSSTTTWLTLSLAGVRSNNSDLARQGDSGLDDPNEMFDHCGDVVHVELGGSSVIFTIRVDVDECRIYRSGGLMS